MNITRFTFWMSLASFAFVSGCAKSKPDSEQLELLLRRSSALEQRIHELEVSNAELQKQVRTLQEREQRQIPGVPPLTPPQSPRMPPWIPPAPPRSQPPSNEEPHLTPLDTK
jgi:hypothetical protein